MDLGPTKKTLPERQKTGGGNNKCNAWPRHESCRNLAVTGEE